jgi:hypothetical protein
LLIRGLTSGKLPYQASANNSASLATDDGQETPPEIKAFLERVAAKNHGNSASRPRMMVTPTSLSVVSCSPPIPTQSA